VYLYHHFDASLFAELLYMWPLFIVYNFRISLPSSRITSLTTLMPLHQLLVVVLRHWSLVETGDRLHIVGVGAVDHLVHSRPDNIAQAHDAHLGAGDDLKATLKREVISVEVFLTEQDGHHLCVGSRAGLCSLHRRLAGWCSCRRWPLRRDHLSC
jgi:hypothetical protein